MASFFYQCGQRSLKFGGGSLDVKFFFWLHIGTTSLPSKGRYKTAYMPSSQISLVELHQYVVVAIFAATSGSLASCLDVPHWERDGKLVPIYGLGQSSPISQFLGLSQAHDPSLHGIIVKPILILCSLMFAPIIYCPRPS